MKNHRGACLPPRHELRHGQIKYGRRRPLCFLLFRVYTCVMHLIQLIWVR